MTELGRFTDRYGSTVRVVREDDALAVYADSPGSHYEHPSPHMTSGMAVQLAALLCGLDAKTSADAVETNRSWKDYGGEPVIDLNGHQITVRESSIAGEACVWLFCTDPEPRQARYEAHKAVYGSWTPEEQEARLPTWIRYDYRVGSDHTQLRDYTDCPEEKEEMITSWLHQNWPGEAELPPSPVPHLSPEMAREVAGRLMAFVEDVGDPSHWRNSDEYKAAWCDDEGAEA
jgi:hypothetical protein